MPFYVAISGEKRGPFPAFRVIDLLRAGEVDPDSLGWEQGMSSWVKLREIPAFAEAIEAMESEPEIPASETGEFSPEGSVTRATPALPPPLPAGAAAAAGTRPFTRFWARAFDYMLVSTVAWQFCEVPPLPENVTPWDLMKNDGTLISEEALMKMAGIQYSAMLIWHLVEGLLMHLWGTTPGKAILGVRVSAPDGRLLSIPRGLGRAFLAWATGFGFGLFPFNLLGMAIGLAMLQFSGATLWDRRLNILVQHQAVTAPRILMAIGGFLLLMIISSSKFS